MSKKITLAQRIAAPTPPHFKKVRKWGKIATIVGGALATLSGVVFPPLGLAGIATIATAVGTSLATIGATTMAVASTAAGTDDTETTPTTN